MTAKAMIDYLNRNAFRVGDGFIPVVVFFCHALAVGALAAAGAAIACVDVSYGCR